MKNVFLISVKKIIKHFVRKSFSVIRGLQWASANTPKKISETIFFSFPFFHAYEKKNSIISRFFSQKNVDLVKNMCF